MCHWSRNAGDDTNAAGVSAGIGKSAGSRRMRERGGEQDALLRRAPERVFHDRNARLRRPRRLRDGDLLDYHLQRQQLGVLGGLHARLALTGSRQTIACSAPGRGAAAAEPSSGLISPHSRQVSGSRSSVGLTSNRSVSFAAGVAPSRLPGAPIPAAPARARKSGAPGAVLHRRQALRQRFRPGHPAASLQQPRPRPGTDQRAADRKRIRPRSFPARFHTLIFTETKFLPRISRITRITGDERKFLFSSSQKQSFLPRISRITRITGDEWKFLFSSSQKQSFCHGFHGLHGLQATN